MPARAVRRTRTSRTSRRSPPTGRAAGAAPLAYPKIGRDRASAPSRVNMPPTRRQGISVHRDRLLIQAYSYLEILSQEPRIAAHLGDLQAEGDAALDDFDRHQRDVARRLKPLRQKLVELAPEADDSATPAPSPANPESAPDYIGSLASFDATAEVLYLVPERLPAYVAHPSRHHRRLAQAFGWEYRWYSDAIQAGRLGHYWATVPATARDPPAR